MFSKAWNVVNQKLDFDRKETVLKMLQDASSPNFDFFLLIVLSCTIATFGLITDSTAVIIGAMLVAPLMSPIMAISLSSVAGEQRMFKRAAVALLEGIALAIALSALTSLLFYRLPLGALQEIPAEILSRTRPSPFDLGIALAGGAAAAYALAQPQLSAALPGVAISTALMPPLCTVGIGITLQSPSVTFGALLLFLTNLLAISFSGIVVYIWVGFRPLNMHRRWHGLPRSVLISLILVLLVTIPLSVLTIRSVQQANEEKVIRSVVEENVQDLPDGQLVDMKVSYVNETVNLEISVMMPRQPSHQQLVDLQSNIAARLEKSVALKLIVIPMTELDPLVPPTATITAVFTPTITTTHTQTTQPSITPTITSSPTITATPSATPTQTSTPTPTATLMIARLSGLNGNFLYVRSEAAGKILFALPDGSYLRLTGNEKTVNTVLWLEVQDLLDRNGWVPAQYVVVQP